MIDDDDNENKRYKPPMTEREKERLRLQHKDWIHTIIFHSVAGFLFGTLAVVAILWLDINGIGTMVANSDRQITFVVLLVAGFGSTFGMAVSGTAIWFKATEDTEEK